MRLITKTTFWFLILAVFVFGMGGLFTLSLIREAAQDETDIELRRSMWQVRRALQEGQDITPLQNRLLSVQVFTPGPVFQPDSIFVDTLIYHYRTERMEAFRKLIVDFSIGEQFYHMEVSDIFFEEEDLEGIASRIILRLFLILTIVFLLGSFLISRRLLQPFEGILRAVESFNLKKGSTIELPETSTSEFKRLEEFLHKMLGKAAQDYRSLKEFSENASHEMQTPIAIAQGKLELLQDADNLQPSQHELILSAQQSLSKLSKLGKALALLTKIENHEFSALAAINFSQLTERIVSDFTELSDLQGIRLTSEVQPGVTLRIDPILADVLLTNLLKNALQHNLPDGWISLHLTPSALLIENAGLPPVGSTELLFERFRKSHQTKGNLGLGLAIIREICEVNNFHVEYTYEEGVHRFRVVFPEG